MQVAICALTYERPEGLKRLLDGLSKLTFPKCEIPDLEIVIIDNDVNSCTCAFCEEISLNFKWTLKCYVESQRGISYARNKAVACTSKNVDFIAFIDDDEVPEPVWLDELLYVQHLYNADVVSGPVLPYFSKPAPVWILEGKFFERPRYFTGYSLKAASTNNVLIRSSVFRGMNTFFDEFWALSGGEDWDFFQRVSRAGYQIVWADEALVYEWIPESRINEKWLLARSYRTGNTESLCEIRLNSSIITQFMFSVKAIRRMIKGGLFIPLSFLLGKHVFIKNLRYVFHSAGMLAGVVGRRYDEYRIVHND